MIYSIENFYKTNENIKVSQKKNRKIKGVKKTTVDELVKRTGIPKGTFYLFYPSKEMLLFDVSQENINLIKT